jgi:hypothetical protein
VGEGAAERNRVQKVLEDANVKLGNVLSDVFGMSGQAMLEALLENKRMPQKLPNWHTGVWRQRFRRLRKPWKVIE